MKKTLIMFILILSLILIDTYSYLFHNDYYPSIYALHESPEKHQNKLVEYSGGDIISINPADKEFIYQEGNDKINFQYQETQNPKKSILGKTSVFGRFTDNYISLLGIHNHNHNYFKYLLSIFGVVIFVYYLFKEWELKGLKFHPKKEAE